MEFIACLVFIGLMFFCSPVDHVKTAASIFWLVILFIGFITSPVPTTTKKEAKKCPPQSNTKA